MQKSEGQEALPETKCVTKASYPIWHRPNSK